MFFFRASHPCKWMKLLVLNWVQVVLRFPPLSFNFFRIANTFTTLLPCHFMFCFLWDDTFVVILVTLYETEQTDRHVLDLFT